MKTEAVRGRHDDRPRTKLQASHIYRDLRELMWPRRNLFFVGLLLVFINRAAGLVLPASTKYLMDDVDQKRRQGFLIPIEAAPCAATLGRPSDGRSLRRAPWTL